MKHLLFPSFCLYLLFPTIASFGQCISSDFSIPHEVCIGENIQISNNANVATSAWDFCSGDLNTIESYKAIVSNNIFYRSRSLKIIQDQEGLWFGFVISVTENRIARLDFGNNLSNLPNVVDLGNLGNLLNGAYDLEVFSEGTNWFAIVSNTSANNLLLLEFGSSLTNTPIAKTLGEFPQLRTPNAISIVKDRDNIYAFVSNGAVANIIVFNFGNSILNSPNLSSFEIPGGSGLRGSSFIKECNKWYALVVSYNNSQLFKLAFNSDISNSPEIEQLSVPNLNLNYPANVELKYEGSMFHAFIQSAVGNLSYISFGSTISSSIGIGSNLGNFNLSTSNFPLQVVQENSKWFLFNINQNDRMLNRFDFANNCSANLPTSNEREPANIKYTAPGTYNITLTDTDENGNISSKTKSIVVNSSEAPEIDFNFSSEKCIIIPKEFTASSTPSQTLTSHTWDFGDGTTATDEEVTHQYTAPGTYKVRLTVEADGGCGNFIEKEVHIYEAPEPAFSFPTATLCTNGEIAFENLTPGEYNDDITWLWDFGDGSTSTEMHPVHTYQSGGTKTVTLTASIPGCSASISHTLEVIEGPNVDFIAANLCFGEEVEFTNLTLGDDITGYSWDFGNGEISSEISPTTTFSAPGAYAVSLTVTTASGCNNTMTKTITIRNLPQVNFVHAMSCSGIPTAFEDRSTVAEGSISSWLWDFGDGHTSTQKNPSHAFEEPGTYEVKLIATSSHGCVDSATQTVLVKAAPKADFSMEIGCVGALSRFTDATVVPDGDEIVNRVWVINSATFYSRNPEVPFTQPGTYEVKLTVTSSNGCISSTTKTIVIDPLPTVDFAVDNTCVGDRVIFTDLSQVAGEDRIIDWQWQFGGVTTSQEQHPEVVFPQAGNVLVTLAVTTERGCTESIHRTIKINAQPEAAFSIQKNAGAPPLQVEFKNNTIGGVGYQWLFGDPDNSSSTEENPVFTYNDIGRYEAKLIVTNATGCKDTASVFIETLDPKMDIALEALNTFTISGDIQTVLKLSNKGSITIQDLDILIDLGGELTLKEKFSGNILAGETVNYPLSMRLSEKDMAKVPYICATVVVNNGDFSETDTDNNKACKEIAKEFVLLTPYPNPVEGWIFLNFVMPEQSPVTLTVTNNLGKVVVDMVLAGTKVGLNEYELDFATLPAGSYIMKVQYQDSAYLRKVMIK